MEKWSRTNVRTDAVTALALLLLGAVLLASGSGLIRQWQDSAARRESLTVEHLLGAAAAVSGAALLAWWLLSAVTAATAVVLERHGRIRAASVACKASPAFMRRLAVAAVSVQLLSGAVANAAAPVTPGPQWAPTLELTTPTPAPTYYPASPPEAHVGTAEGAATHGSTSPATPPVLSDPVPSPASGTGSAESQNPGSAAAVDATPTAASVPAPAAPPPLQPAWQPSAPVVEPGLLASPDLRGGLVAGEGTGHSAHGPVAVLAGDTLWDIVADHLGPGASDVEVALEWPRWYAANRAVIGQDPDVLLPGQVLQPPSQP